MSVSVLLVLSPESSGGPKWTPDLPRNLPQIRCLLPSPIARKILTFLVPFHLPPTVAPPRYFHLPQRLCHHHRRLHRLHQLPDDLRCNPMLFVSAGMHVEQGWQRQLVRGLPSAVSLSAVMNSTLSWRFSRSQHRPRFEILSTRCQFFLSMISPSGLFRPSRRLLVWGVFSLKTRLNVKTCLMPLRLILANGLLL